MKNAGRPSRMDPFLRSFFESFCEKFELPVEHANEEQKRSLEDRNFERFVNFYVLNTSPLAWVGADELTTVDGSFNAKGSWVSKDDAGIDGINILVNGIHCSDVDDIESLTRGKTGNTIHIHFCQSKNSKDKSKSSISGFIDSIEHFLDPAEWQSEAGEADGFDSLVWNSHAIYARMVNQGISKSRPTIEITWACSGVRTIELEEVHATVWSRINRLPATTPIDRCVETRFLGADDLVNAVRDFEGANKCVFDASELYQLGEPIMGVGSAYMGWVSGREFLKIIAPEGELDDGLFEDNVRDYLEQGSDVNKAINRTLADGEFRKQFAIRNNGVTIVAESVNKPNRDCHLESYQVVNGCQTSNVIYENRDNLDGVWVPVRVIETNDAEILDGIVASTNSQNAVSSQDMLARTKLARDLERYCERPEHPDRIFFERRRGQYRRSSDVKLNRVLTKLDFTRAFVACVEGVPHDAIGYTDQYAVGAKNVWATNVPVELMYLAGFIHSRIELGFQNNRRLDSSLKPLRCHLEYAVVRTFKPEILTRWSGRRADVDGSVEQDRRFGELMRDSRGLLDRISEDDDALFAAVKNGETAARMVMREDGMKVRYPDGIAPRALTKTRGFNDQFMSHLESILDN